jgi:hypothetical protein
MQSFSAPLRGWIRNEARVSNKGDGADVLDNWFPTATGARVRGGSELYATVGAGTRVGAIIPYVAGATKKLFAANDTAIYDITTVVDSAVSPAAAVAALTSGDWAFVQFTTSGGTYLRLVNGVDTPLIYDGAAWGTAPLITGVTDENLLHVWVFKNRLFFVEKNTLNSWYLATDSIGGAATKFPLGGVFKRGGSLVFGGSWAVDTGSGLGEKCVFVTSEGEVAIYEGTDPASAASWALEGVYRVGRPLGQRAVFRAGGDLAIATDVGIVPLSQAITTDLGALGQKAITRQIEDEWADEVVDRVGLYPWHVEMWPTKQMMLVAMPSYSTLPEICFVANIRTGAWTRYTGWDTHSLGLYQDRLFFGTSTGTVIEAEVGGNDQGDSYTAKMALMFSDCGAGALQKFVSLARPVYLTSQSIGDKVSTAFDYVSGFPTAPNAATPLSGGNTWGTGVWGTFVWSEGSEQTVQKNWVAVTGEGLAVAPSLQVTVGQDALPDIELMRIDLQFTVGKTPG